MEYVKKVTVSVKFKNKKYLTPLEKIQKAIDDGKIKKTGYQYVVEYVKRKHGVKDIKNDELGEKLKVSHTKFKNYFKDFQNSAFVSGNGTKGSAMMNVALKADKATYFAKNSILNTKNYCQEMKKIPYCTQISMLTDTMFQQMSKINMNKLHGLIIFRLRLLRILLPDSVIISKELMIVTSRFFSAHKDFECGGNYKEKGTGFQNIVAVFNLFVGGEKKIFLASDHCGHNIRVMQCMEFDCRTGTLIVMLGDLLDSYWHAVYFEPDNFGFYITLQYRIATNPKLVKKLTKGTKRGIDAVIGGCNVEKDINNKTRKRKRTKHGKR